MLEMLLATIRQLLWTIVRKLIKTAVAQSDTAWKEMNANEKLKITPKEISSILVAALATALCIEE